MQRFSTAIENDTTIALQSSGYFNLAGRIERRKFAATGRILP